MAGFAAGIGGFGQAAGEFGHQIRGILEQRREHLASILAGIVPELGGQDRNDMIRHIAGIASGEPLGKHMLGVTKVLQSHQADQTSAGQAVQNFSQMVGPQKPPETRPVPAGPGQTPGTAVAQQPASMTPINPIQGGSQIQPVGDMTNPTPAQQSAADAEFFRLTGGAPEGQPPAQPEAQFSPEASSTQFTFDRSQLPPVQRPSMAGGPIAGGEADPMARVRALRDSITAKYTPIIQNASQNMRPRLQAMYEKEIADLKPFEEQAFREYQLGRLQATPEYKNAPDFMKFQPVEAAYGFAPSGMGGLASIMRVRPYEVDATHMSAMEKTALGLPPNATGKMTVEMDGMGNPTGRTMQGWAGTTPTLSATGQQGRESINDVLRDSGVVTAPGGGPSMAQSMVAPHVATDFSGRLHAVSAPQLNQGNFYNPQFIPRTSSTTQTQPGTFPITTTRLSNIPVGATGPQTAAPTAQTPAAPPPPAPAGPAPTAGPVDPRFGTAEPVIKPVTPTPAAPTPSGPAVKEDPVVVRNYESWVNQGQEPSGKYKDPVLDYARRNKLPIPVVLSPAGQKALVTTDQVLDQIDVLKAEMQKAGIDKMKDRSYYSDYWNYAHSIPLLSSTPKYGNVWMNISFEKFRSVAAAMSGISSRAYQILNKAFEHTPDPAGELPHFKLLDPLAPLNFKGADTGETMYRKLEDMEKLLRRGRDYVLQDERKGGTIVPPVAGAAPAGLSEEEKAKVDKILRGK